MSRARSIGTIVFVLALILLVLLLIVLPAVASLLATQMEVAPPWLTDMLNFSEGFTRWFMLAFVLIWVFFLGGTFASFLNVVAWRVPRGRSILGSSHCPHCNIKLSFKDNIPFVGWLRNTGKCSNCQNPISVRYLMVEIALGAMFLLIAAIVITTGGATLPFRQPDQPSHWYSLIFDPRFDLIQIVIFHWTMILVLYTLALIELEWLAIPWRVWAVGVFVGLMLLLIWPGLILVDWQFPFASFDVFRILDQAIFVTCGMSAGAVCGWILDRSQFVADQPNSFLFGTTVVGLFLGWQSVVIVVCLTVVMMLLSTRWNPAPALIRNMLHSPHTNLLLATLIHLVTWRWFQFL